MSGFIRFSAFKRITKLFANHCLVGHDGGGNNIQISFKDFWDQLDIEASGGGGDPIYFTGNQLPSENNVGDPLLKGDWTILEGGITYININGANPLITSANDLNFGRFNGSSWSLIRQPLPTIDTSEFIKKSDLESNSLIPTNSPYIQNNTVINSLGAILTNPVQYTNAKSIINFPLEPNTTYTIGGFLASNGKNFALADSAGSVIGVSNLITLPKTFTTDNTHILLRCTIKQRDIDEPTDDNWINTLMLAEGFVLPITTAVKKIDGMVLEAAVLSSDNITPSPTTDFNAVNLLFYNKNTLKRSDLVVRFSSNLARQVLNETIVPDKFINSLGGISVGIGWVMYAFYPLLNGLIAGDSFIVHNYSISGGGYVAWYESSVMKSFEGAINGLTPKVFTVPLNSTNNTILYFDISRPADTGLNYKNLTINSGTVALPYVEPKVTIIKIDEYEIAGGVSSFKDLTDVPQYTGNAGKILQINSAENGLEAVENTNSGGDVVFDSVTTNFLVVNDVPIWDEVSATDVVVGQEYLFNDGSGNYFKKVRGV